jgi:hypothetical protein
MSYCNVRKKELNACFSEHISPIGKPEGKRLHGRPWNRYEDKIKIDLKKEIGYKYEDCFYLAQNMVK